MPLTFIELIETHKKTTRMHDVEEAANRIAQEANLLVIDVREPAEYENASLASAVNIPRGFIEFRIADSCSAPDQPVLLHCKTGGRAVLAARTLAEMGYSNVAVVGGTIEDLLAAVD